MRILVLGAAGVIGSSVIRLAAHEGHEAHAALRPTRAVDRFDAQSATRIHRLDLLDRAQLAGLIEGVEPDAIVHAAFPPLSGKDADARACLLGEGLGLTFGLTEVLRGLRYTGSLVLLGSATSYGPALHAHDPGDRLAPTTFRGMVKASESLMVAQFAAETGCRLTELRLFTAYGPWEQPDRLVPTLMRAALLGSSVSLTARPHARDWVHVDDVAQACLLAAGTRRQAAVIHNVCGGELVDTHRLARKVEEITGRKLVRDHAYPDRDAYGDGHPLGLPPTCGAEFAWAPHYSLDEGLAQTWEWARSAAGRAYLLAGSGRRDAA